MSRLSVDPTEAIIANSLEIYEQEAEQFKKVGGKYKCLCYHGENTPSCVINDYEPFLYKCFGCGDAGNVISFVAKSHNISYSEAILHIQGLKIDLNKSVGHKKVKENKEIIIDFVDKPFTKEDRKYWGKYGLPEDFLRDNNVFSVKTYAINKKIIKHDDNRLIFAYYCPENGKCKLLFIGKSVEKSEKWKSNIESSYLWFLPKTPCNQLWVVKSVKDALCLKYHFSKCVTAVQSENAKILDANMPRILEVSKDIVINFGADAQAIDACKPVQQKWQTKYFNTDKTMLKYGVVDPSDVIAAFGVKVLEKQLKNKGFL